MADTRKRKIDRVDFLSEHVMALKGAIHTDVILKPGDGDDEGPGIRTHKAILAMRSKVFRNMLDSDECKVSLEKSITLPDMSYEVLESLLEFLYTGTLSHDNKHIRALYLAANKYDIQYLQDHCRDLLIRTIGVHNVVDILELSTIPCDTILKEAAITYAKHNFDILIHSKRYESFVESNPSLSLELTRACVAIWDVQYEYNRHQERMHNNQI